MPKLTKRELVELRHAWHLEIRRDEKRFSHCQREKANRVIMTEAKREAQGWRFFIVPGTNGTHRPKKVEAVQSRPRVPAPVPTTVPAEVRRVPQTPYHRSYHPPAKLVRFIDELRLRC